MKRVELDRPLDSAAAHDMWFMLNEINSHMWETVMVGKPVDKDTIMGILDEWAGRY